MLDNLNSNYLVWLVLSAICVNGVHSYLLLSQTSDRKWSISEHATLNSNTRLIYVLGHLFGGAFFLLFAHSYFVDKMAISSLFNLSCIIVLFEYIQALLPAKGSTNLAHTVAAYIMWVSFILLNGLALVTLPVSSFSRLIASVLYIAVIVLFVYSHFRRSQLYKYQMLMVPLFFLSLGVLIV